MNGHDTLQADMNEAVKEEKDFGYKVGGRGCT